MASLALIEDIRDIAVALKDIADSYESGKRHFNYVVNDLREEHDSLTKLLETLNV